MDLEERCGCGGGGGDKGKRRKRKKGGSEGLCALKLLDQDRGKWAISK